MLGVVFQFIAGLRMDEHGEPAAVQRQPGHHLTEFFRRKGELAAPVRVRPDRALMHPPHLDAEFVSAPLAQRAGLIEGVGVEIDVGVEGLDLGHGVALVAWAGEGGLFYSVR